ncbi:MULTISPECIES: two-component system response regulator CreB [unclassified Acinetobacter]|uniref:two-component system response regulator CreB n=1 Tax=unclassified Acinetobacter TaxID=196816 RepID=UPI0035BACF0D
MQKHILCVEDEMAILLPLRYALEREGWTVKAVGLGQDALELCQQQHFDFIILDIGLPDINGFDVCRQLRQFCQTPLLFLTARDDEIDRIVGLEIGADDYCTKPFSAREIVSRIKVIWRRMQPLDMPNSPQSLTVNNQTIANNQNNDTTWQVFPQKLQILYQGKTLNLTRYEYGLLSILIQSPEQVFSRTQLMDAVWEYPEHSLERTVDTHIKSLRQKLKHIDPEQDWIITHRGVGYSLKKVD